VPKSLAMVGKAGNPAIVLLPMKEIQHFHDGRREKSEKTGGGGKHLLKRGLLKSKRIGVRGISQAKEEPEEVTIEKEKGRRNPQSTVREIFFGGWE